MLISVTCLIFILFTFAYPLPLLANSVFDEFKDAILNQPTKIKIQGLCQKYNGERLDGWAYVVSISNDDDGNSIVNLSTKKNYSSLEAIHVVVFLRQYLVGKKLKAKVGDYVRFIGNLQEIRMNTIILSEGVVKY
ncbi:MAG: hypothetical protein K9L86_01645 [Candidatus Omnitrophica bacterium]|nr:hypothetical protein [Candidatus Omnitrophota bacterium]